MKLIIKIIKWIVKILAGFIILILISGLCFRLFVSLQTPPGEIIDVNGTKLHIRAEGKKMIYQLLFLNQVQVVTQMYFIGFQKN